MIAFFQLKIFFELRFCLWRTEIGRIMIDMLVINHKFEFMVFLYFQFSCIISCRLCGISH